MSKKKNKNKKRQNSNKKVIERKVEVHTEKSKLQQFLNKKWVRIAIHIISAYIWINFIYDMSTFTSRETYPNIIVSILALVTFVLEWNIIRPYNK